MFGIFDSLTKSVENVLDIGGSLISGEDIQKRQIAKLIADGVEVYTIASTLGVAESVVKELMRD